MRSADHTPTDGTLACAACDHTIPVQSRFCPHCGTATAYRGPQETTRPEAGPTVSGHPLSCVDAMPAPQETSGDAGRRESVNCADPEAQRGGACPQILDGAMSDSQLPSDQIRCPCGTLLSPDARFCGACGQPAQVERPALFRLVARTGTGRRSVHPVDGCVTIGSAEMCPLRVADDVHLSREHARIEIVGDRLVLEDLMSSNGTFVRVRQPFLLQEGDEILVGTTIIRAERVTSPPGANDSRSGSFSDG